MRDSPFRLQDKTILLTGPFNGTTQALLRTLTEFGADIAYVNEQTPKAAKYCDGVNEAREARPDYGRTAYYQLPLDDAAQVRDALGRLAESIGRVDVFVEASPLGWTVDTNTEAALKRSTMIVDQLLPFFKARQRGRVVYVFEDQALAATGVGGFLDSFQEPLINHIRETATHLKSQAVTVNGLAVGLTEDFLLRHFPSSGSIKKSLVEVQSRLAGARIIEPIEVASALAYLSCAASGGLTGQVLRLF